MTKSDQPIRPTKSNFIRDLMLLIGLPAAIVVVLMGVVWLPNIFAKPQYDFVYSICSSYQCQDSYSISSSGNIVANKTSNDDFSSRYDNYELRYYNVKTGSSRALNDEEISRLKLDGNSKSPDGYEFVDQSTKNYTFLWQSKDSGMYLKKGLARKSVNLDSANHYTNPKLLGWVEK